MPKLHHEIEHAAAAVQSLGVPVRLTDEQPEGTFVGGVWIDEGIVTVNPRLALFGDVFHEAGHLAVTPSKVRHLWRPTSNLEDPKSPLMKATGARLEEAFLHPDDPEVRALLQMGECEAIAWEYAALVGTGLDPERAFGHPERFQGNGLELVEMLSAGCHFGVHGLSHAGMTTKKIYPKMLKWLQD